MTPKRGTEGETGSARKSPNRTRQAARGVSNGPLAISPSTLERDNLRLFMAHRDRMLKHLIDHICLMSAQPLMEHEVIPAPAWRGQLRTPRTEREVLWGPPPDPPPPRPPRPSLRAQKWPDDLDRVPSCPCGYSTGTRKLEASAQRLYRHVRRQHPSTLRRFTRVGIFSPEMMRKNGALLSNALWSFWTSEQLRRHPRDLR